VARKGGKSGKCQPAILTRANLATKKKIVVIMTSKGKRPSERAKQKKGTRSAGSVRGLEIAIVKGITSSVRGRLLSRMKGVPGCVLIKGKKGFETERTIQEKGKKRLTHDRNANKVRKGSRADLQQTPSGENRESLGLGIKKIHGRIRTCALA